MKEVLEVLPKTMKYLIEECKQYDALEEIREIGRVRKETIERVFADAKEKHAMRYTHHRGLARVTAWVRLKYAAMNLKKLAVWKWNTSDFFALIAFFVPFNAKTPVLVDPPLSR